MAGGGGECGGESISVDGRRWRVLQLNSACLAIQNQRQVAIGTMDSKVQHHRVGDDKSMQEAQQEMDRQLKQERALIDQMIKQERENMDHTFKQIHDEMYKKMHLDRKKMDEKVKHERAAMDRTLLQINEEMNRKVQQECTQIDRILQLERTKMDFMEMQARVDMDKKIQEERKDIEYKAMLEQIRMEGKIMQDRARRYIKSEHEQFHGLDASLVNMNALEDDMDMKSQEEPQVAQDELEHWDIPPPEQDLQYYPPVVVMEFRVFKDQEFSHIPKGYKEEPPGFTIFTEPSIVEWWELKENLGHQGYKLNSDVYFIKPGCGPPEGMVLISCQKDVDRMMQALNGTKKCDLYIVTNYPSPDDEGMSEQGPFEPYGDSWEYNNTFVMDV